jgi:hypothetical protein
MARTIVAVAALALALPGCSSCRGERRADGRAASPRIDAPPTDATVDGAATTFGPPNPWGPLPSSTATGPEADATRATLTALRASIGFWRIERDARAYCPTLDDLALTPGAAFDRTTMGHDAWGTALDIECQGERVRVRSLGPDRTRGTADDLVAE